MNEKLLAANGRLIRIQGIVYRIISVKLGSRILSDAEPLNGSGVRINLIKTRSDLGRALRNLVDLGLFV